MLKDRRARLLRINPEAVPKEFARLGWIGFWMQIALLAFPIVLLFYVTFLSGPGGSAVAQRKGIDLGQYLSYGSLLVLLFTTFWSYRYTRLAKRMVNRVLYPSDSSVADTLWIGLLASGLGILFSILVMMSAVGRMLLVFLATPQGGVPLIKPVVADSGARWVSTIDAVGLLALVFTLTAELIVLGFSLWLLFRVTQVSMRPTA